MYLEVLPRERFEFGFGRFWCGANVRPAFLPYTVLLLLLRPEKKLKSPICLLH